MEKEVKYIPSVAESDTKFVPETQFAGVSKKKAAVAKLSANSRLSFWVSVATFAAVLVLFTVFFVYVREEVEVKHEGIMNKIDELEKEVNDNTEEIQGMKQYSIQEMKDNPCLQPKQVGPCEAAVPRWFYNPYLGQCSQFLFGGCQGNENNFVTLTSCARRCEEGNEPENEQIKKKDVPRINIQIEERDPKKLLSPDQFDNGGIAIEDSEYNMIGPDFEAENPCELEPSAGPCRALLPRFYFDRQEGNCMRFLYGGCSGNTNNFMTEVECLNKCGQDKPEMKKIDASQTRRPFCYLPAEVGLCRALVERWSFDPEAGECARFFWGGCGGNENNFSSKDKCETACAEVDTDDDLLVSAREFDGPVDRCGLPKEIGPCRAAMPRYYYNLSSEKCERFNFGGCDGNENNFESLEACQTHCTEEL